MIARSVLVIEAFSSHNFDAMHIPWRVLAQTYDTSKSRRREDVRIDRSCRSAQTDTCLVDALSEWRLSTNKAYASVDSAEPMKAMVSCRSTAAQVLGSLEAALYPDHILRTHYDE